MAGKRYTNARAQVDRERAYPPLEAVRTLTPPSSTRPSRCTCASG
jgi:hypothetical protein